MIMLFGSDVTDSCAQPIQAAYRKQVIARGEVSEKIFSSRAKKEGLPILEP